MQHVDILFVFSVYISSILHEQLDNVQVTMECCEVEGSETLIPSTHCINPFFKLLLLLFLILMILNQVVFPQYLHLQFKIILNNIM
jgi:hypothetical protein